MNSTLHSGLQRILYIDTTSKTLMVGISEAGEMKATRREAAQSHRYHSAILVPTIQELLDKMGLKSSDLTALAVNIGPGSFTGIRTGLSSIRTFGQFLDIPVYAFNTFEVLACNEPDAVSRIYIDALQSNAYHARLCFQADGPCYLTQPALVSMEDITKDSLIERETEHVIFSESLRPYFGDFEAQTPARFSPIETPTRFTPDAMCQLINKHQQDPSLSPQQTHPFVYPWDDVKALYLQNPNITLRKPRSGTLK